MSAVEPLPAPAQAPDLPSLHAPLLRYAQARMRNAALAEDAVSETVLAALEEGREFATATQATAWMFGILRHKLVDQLREQTRETPAGDSLPEGSSRGGAWDGAGSWHGGACAFDEPDAAYAHRQLIGVVQAACLRLPDMQRRAFMMRELYDMETDQICRELNVSPGNLWVLAHRARQRLRTLLDHAWPELREASPVD